MPAKPVTVDVRVRFFGNPRLLFVTLLSAKRRHEAHVIVAGRWSFVLRWGWR